MITLWHNPRCAKSREALRLLEERGAQVRLRRYLDEPPTEEELRQLLRTLGIGARDLMRTKEARFREAGLSADDPEDRLIGAMVAHPILIERPVALRGDRAVIGRPPEKVLDLV
ncbi:MAG: arsenate reductase (glutaredoxin) [Rhodosalinus sp.]